MNARLAALSLLFGNFFVGVCVLAPAGMLSQLAAGLGVTVAQAGLLVTYGAVVLCIGSPLMSWWTSRMDRRALLSGILLVMAAGHLASAFAPSYPALLAIRLLMVAVAAPYTPQAASTAALLVPERQRASAIAFVFLGWSLSVAVGLPLVNFLAAHYGWRASYGVFAGGAALGALSLIIWLPAGLRGAAVSLKSWAAIAHHHQIRLILLLTALQVAGQFALFTYLSPLLVQLAGANAGTIGAFFAIFGIMGVVGNVVATRLASRYGAFRSSFLFLLSMLAGVAMWTFGAGAIPIMAVGMGLWGLGFAAMNSMQQARLVAAAPPLASGSVALNTSAIYVGQAVGSAIGGFFLAHDRSLTIGYLAVALLIASLLLLMLTRAPGERMVPA
ncbi:MAG TPA: MFS transporter [Myxococcaceae bacterium]|jgi:predicted MFS family arabinose efflux permease|nr:MFS transporter [Myxococcaceae bacterium]